MSATTPWHQDRQVGFDVESTGVSVHDDRIITAAVIHATPGERPRSLTWIIDPGIEIPAEAAAVHGWTRDTLRAHIGDGNRAISMVGGRVTGRYTDPAQAIYEIAGQVALAISVGAPLVAFNASFDLSMLEAECRRHGVDTVSSRLPKGIRGVVDPFVLDKKYSRRKGSRKLVDQCAHYGVLHGGAHEADADALATLRVLRRQIAAYPELAGMSLSKLHGEQVKWRRQQMDSLRTYFDRMGKEHDGCCGEWPLHAECVPATTAVAS